MNEFEDVQRIWDSQSNQVLYVLNEEAMFRRITDKKNQAANIINISEWLLVIVNMIAGGFILGTGFPNTSATNLMHIMAVWMLGTASYLIAGRIRRIKEGSRFDRTMRGDLAYAIWLATCQVRLSQLMRWNIVPVGVLIMLGLWAGDKPLWIALPTLAFFALAFYLGRWEHGIYLSRKRELEILQRKLEKEA